MTERRLCLARRFQQQRDFAAGYSPLYARLFGLLADWLSVEPPDPMANWLVQAGAGRASFDVPLLLLAGLHRDILLGSPEVQGLAAFYPSVGGKRPVEEPELVSCLRAALLARQQPLVEFLRAATVQTNETARGLCWLLPVLAPGWAAIHLLDLGASAGLNLVADQRHYCLRREGDRNGILTLGQGPPPQFEVLCRGDFALPARNALPSMLSRTGCDLAPFSLSTFEEEESLAAFVWGDQVGRLALLRQGIAALHQVNQSPSPVQLHPARLPEGLSIFLETRTSFCADAPVVLYNTYLTAYLKDKEASLRPQLAHWAARHPQPVLWLQWEPLWQGPEPPEFGWLGWTADLWYQGTHRHWHFAWVQPHGTHLQWLSGWAEWTAFWQGTTTRSSTSRRFE